MAFLATTDPARARSFYEGALGMRLIADEPFALVFDARGTMLRISKVDKANIAPYTVLGWIVDDIIAEVEALTAKQIVFEHFAGFPQDARGIWTAGDGTRVAWFKDPDGNLLSLTQFP